MKFLIALLVFLGAHFSAFAQESQIFIDVGQAQVKKSLLALPPPVYLGTQKTNRAHIDAGQALYRVIHNDLAVSGLFEFVKPEAYLEDPMKVGLRPAPGAPNGFNIANWKTIGTEFLVRAAYQVVGNQLKMEAYVYHVPTGKQILGRNYESAMSGSRQMAHSFANDLVAALTGKKSMFHTRIVACRQKVEGKSAKEVVVMDWDGSNQKQITEHGDITLSPTWSRKGDRIAYTAFVMHVANKVRNSDLFVYDLKSGKRFLASYKKGINSGASFFPGDKELVLTMTYKGSPDLYRMNLDGGNITQLTRGPNRALNVEPAVSPDGSKIAFSSDRSGRAMVYVMNADGTNVKRLTFAGTYNSTPAWSPDGKTIAFAALTANHYDIYTISAEGTNLKRLTDAKKANGRSADNESPSWSPDGRHIVFTSDRTGRNQIYVINPDGTNERRITEDNFHWDRPKWSPYLD